MNKFKFLVMAVVLAMATACGSSNTEKGENDSTANATTEQATNADAENVGDQNVEAITQEEKVISYNGTLLDVPAGSVLTPATIQATAHATLIEFGATWCGPCKQAKPIVENLAGKYEGKAEFLYVDIDKCPEIAKEFGVGQAVPVVVVAKADGTFVKVEGLDAIKNQLEPKLVEAIGK